MIKTIIKMGLCLTAICSLLIHVAQAEAVEKPKPDGGNSSKTEYIALRRPVDPRPFASCPEKLALENGAIQCRVSPTAGNIAAVVSLPTRAQVVAETQDAYLFDGQTILEKTDQATGYRSLARDGAQGFELLCVNARLPDIEITKQYTLESNRLVKTTRFRAKSAKGKGKLLFLRATLRLDDEFYKEGCFYRPMWDGGSGPGTGTPVFLPGNEIKEPAKCKDMHTAFFCYVKPSQKLGVAQYRFKVNGYYEGFQTIARQTDIINDDGFFLPNGWDMYLTGDVVREGEFLSCESHLLLFQGDAREFHRCFTQIPDYAELAQARLPAWHKNVKGIGHAQYIAYISGGYNIAERMERILTAFGPDEYLMWLITDWCITGDYTVDGEIIGSDLSGNWAHKTTAAEVKKNMQKLRDLAPDKLKLAMYTWYGSASDKSKIYQQHPDWLLRDQQGQFLQYGSSEVYNYILNPVTWEHLNLKINQYRRLVEYMNLDYTYIDGSHGELINLQPEKNFVHNYHARLFMQGVKKAAEAGGRAHFQNGAVFPDSSHGGYFECGMNQNLVDKRDWRILGNVAYLCRYYHPGAQNASNLYDASQGASNRNIMYGLKPCLSGLWYYNNLCHALLALDLCFEVKDNEMIDGDYLHPNWWNLETRTLESAFLKQGKTWLLPLVNHAEDTRREKVTVSLKGLDLKKGRPIYLWSSQPMIDSGLDFTAHISDALDTVSAELEVREGTDKLEVVTALKPNILKMITFTQVPAFVYSVNGRRNNFHLNSSRGVSIDGASTKDAINLTVEREASISAEIMVLLPEGWSNAATKVNGQPEKVRLISFGKRKFAIVEAPKGKSEVAVTEVKAAEVAEAWSSPKRHPYQDFALGFYPNSGKPKIVAANKEGLPCWEISGDGELINHFNRDFKGTGGVAFKLNPGTAKGEFVVKVGFAGKAYVKKVSLDFTGWKEFSFTKDQFDEKPGSEWRWGEAPMFFFQVPAGSLYLSDFHFLPAPPEEKQPEPKRKRLEVPFTPKPPVLDGELNDECWRSAATVTFAGNDGGDKATISLLYDKERLYVAGKFEEPIVRLPSKMRRDDRSLCTAPNFEMYFIPKGIKKCFQLVTNPSGSQWDAVYDDLDMRIDNADWNGNWKAASSYGFNLFWTVEAAIPFADFDLTTPQKGDTWLTGLFRQGGSAGLSGWMYGGGNFFNIEKSFGEIVFGDQ
ncbi:MAG: hypothetical protein HY360_10390 [Verrucomicrobia bacterium]|nr:hypothetical protein [Verrucomicrobiota bacterium]